MKFKMFPNVRNADPRALISRNADDLGDYDAMALKILSA